MDHLPNDPNHYVRHAFNLWSDALSYAIAQSLKMSTLYKTKQQQIGAVNKDLENDSDV